MRKGSGKKKRVKKLDKIPLGIKVLITYSIILASLYLIFGALVPTNLILGTVVTGIPAFIFNTSLVIAMAVMIYGFYNATMWSYKLAITLYVFSILNSFVSLFFINKTSLSMISNIIIVALVFTILLNLLTTWYVFEKREYFEGKSQAPGLSMVDTVFITVIYLFYFFSVLLLIALGFEIYKSATFIIDDVSAEITNKPLDVSLKICELKQGDYRDICLVAAITAHRRDVGISKLCEKIESRFYRFTCYQTA